MNASSIDEVIARLSHNAEHERSDHWERIRKALNDSGLTIPLEQWTLSPDWRNDGNLKFIYDHIRSEINADSSDIKNGNLGLHRHWEHLLPVILPFNPCHMSFMPIETLDDGICHSEKLADGTIVNICCSCDWGFFSCGPVAEAKDDLEEYIDFGVNVARQIHSRSYDDWVDAQSCFKMIRYAIHEPQNFKLLEDVSATILKAKMRLATDIKEINMSHSSRKNVFIANAWTRTAEGRARTIVCPNGEVCEDLATEAEYQDELEAEVRRITGIDAKEAERHAEEMRAKIELLRINGEILNEVKKPVTVGGFSDTGKSEAKQIIKEAQRKTRTHKPDGALTQEQVAEDFGVSRQTVIQWEAEADADGEPHNKYGYYKDLRTDPNLREAYQMLVNCATQYNKEREKATASGKRFCSFVRFKDEWIKHQPR